LLVGVTGGRYTQLLSVWHQESNDRFRIALRASGMTMGAFMGTFRPSRIHQHGLSFRGRSREA
jgi:hypothetical protein